MATKNALKGGYQSGQLGRTVNPLRFASIVRIYLFPPKYNMEVFIMEQQFDKRILKMTPQELEQHLHFRRKGFVIQNKKGKGSYKRKNKYNIAE